LSLFICNGSPSKVAERLKKNLSYVMNLQFDAWKTQLQSIAHQIMFFSSFMKWEVGPLQIYVGTIPNTSDEN
jgi:hypothetical protein